MSLTNLRTDAVETFSCDSADEDAYRKVVDIENDLEESINLRGRPYIT